MSKFGMIFIGVMLLATGVAEARKLTPMEKALCALQDKACLEGLGNTPVANQSPAAASLAPTPRPEDQLSVTPLSSPQFLPEDGFHLTATAEVEVIAVSWSDTGAAWSNFKGYFIFKGKGSEPGQVINAVPLRETKYQDITVTPNTDYSYQVSAIDAVGVTLVTSQTIQTRLLPAYPPGEVYDLEVSSEEERTRIKWKSAPRVSYNIDGYLVFRATTPTAEGICLLVSPTSKAEFIDNTGEYEVPYYYSVKAVDVKGQTGTASLFQIGSARRRSRSALIWISTAYPGMGRYDTGLTGDLQFLYYIGSLYGEQDKDLSTEALYLDPISLWLLNGDVKYTLLTEKSLPVSVAMGAKGGLMLFAGQQSSTSGSFTFSAKSQVNYLWGGYLTLSRSFGDWGIHGGYMQGRLGDAVFYLSKYLEPESSRNCFYAGLDFPIVRRMNAAWEIIYPLDSQLQSQQRPLLINLHVDRLFNFDVSYLRWNRGWALLGYFNIRFTVFPGQ